MNAVPRAIPPTRQAVYEDVVAHLSPLALALTHLAWAGIPVIGYEMESSRRVINYTITVPPRPALHRLFGPDNCCWIKRVQRGNAPAYLWMALMRHDKNAVVKVQWWEGDHA
jgi:hypothetical protein